jgi:hypothetical protein
MANDSGRVSILDELLRDAGIAIDGISVIDINATPPDVAIQFKVDATQEQRDLAAQMLADFDWRKRRPLDRGTVVAAMQNLTAQQRALVDRHEQAERLRTNPRLASLLGRALGTPLVVDEVDPT